MWDERFGGWGDTERGSSGNVGGRDSPLEGCVNKEEIERETFEDLRSTFGSDKGQGKEWSWSGGCVETKSDVFDNQNLLESNEIEFV